MQLDINMKIRSIRPQVTKKTQKYDNLQSTTYSMEIVAPSVRTYHEG